MKYFKGLLFLIAHSLCCGFASAQVSSIQLTDYIKSNGTGNINLLRDVDAAQLEMLRSDNGGMIVLGVDVNEASNGTEKAGSQAITVKSVSLTVTYQDSSQKVYNSSDAWFTETFTFVAENPATERQQHYTLVGETGSSRITPNGTSIQESFDSTLKILVPDSLYDADAGIEASSVLISIVLLDTNVSLGDPEAFYDYTNGFEDLALLNAEDAEFIDSYGAGLEEAPLVVLTNPPTESDPSEIVNWNYFPSSSTFYMVGYEDLYPSKGDYDFNDLTVAYQLRYGLNSDNEVVSIRGTAYLLTRGAGYNHDWHLRITLPADVSSALSCDTFLDPKDDYAYQPCDGAAAGSFSGTADIVVFNLTADIFPAPAGETFTNTPKGQSYSIGPKSNFRLDLATPLPASAFAAAPFDPYLQVLNTGENVQLLQVNPAFKDVNGFPFGMLFPSTWQPPNEFFSISTIYQRFDSFVASEGSADADWALEYLSNYVVDLTVDSDGNGLPDWAW